MDNPSFAQVMQIMLKVKRWSPIIWRGGVRHSNNFLESHYLALDFDSGAWTLDDALSFAKEGAMKFILGTTEHHQLPKEKEPACDRFRLIIPWHAPITDLRTYKQNLAKFVERYPCDVLCKDGARMYKPCREIVAWSDGNPIVWNPYLEPVRKKYKPTGIVPYWLTLKLAEVPASGNRNNHAFQLAMSLARFGYSESQVIEEIKRAPIDISDYEKLVTAKSGYKIGVTQRRS